MIEKKWWLREDLRIIFFISLTNDYLIIGIIIVITFLLNWYKFDPLENNPVGEIEIDEKKKNLIVMKYI